MEAALVAAALPALLAAGALAAGALVAGALVEAVLAPAEAACLPWAWQPQAGVGTPRCPASHSTALIH